MMAYNSRSRLSRKEESLELVPLQKKVSVVVCSCSHSNNVEGLIQLIRQHMNDVVETVRYEFLPYNIRDMNKFDLSGIDVLLLCHSIENRRFSITNVTDALYDGFLPRARKHLGEVRVKLELSHMTFQKVTFHQRNYLPRWTPFATPRVQLLRAHHLFLLVVS
eukprot:XP_011679199.1 PREDICTED: uncharacterized protein LOC105445387 isoform X2 [Strongylocentrotus purpuratus]